MHHLPILRHYIRGGCSYMFRDVRERKGVVPFGACKDLHDFWKTQIFLMKMT
ncbi:hypothetical protein LINGRAHAP2_LOCUS3890 [Linum grandiflorum]